MSFSKRKFSRLYENTKQELNNLDSEIYLDYAYNHELLWYGIDGVIHNYIMKKARDIVHKEISLDDFIEKYGLKEFESKKHGFVIPLSKIEEDGIFIPKQKQENDLDREIGLFYKDYINVLKSDKNLKLFRYLTFKDWVPKDLENTELIEKGIIFGKEIWLNSMKGFNDYRKNNPKPKDIENLQGKLIRYYSRLINY